MPITWGSIDNKIGRTGAYLMRHKKLGAAALVAAAAIKVHPFSGISHDTQEGLTGDPRAFDHIIGAAARGAVIQEGNDLGASVPIPFGSIGLGGITTTQQQIGQSDVSHEDIQNYYGGPNPRSVRQPSGNNDRTSGAVTSGMNPSGSIVFGLYNSRLKGP